MADSHYSYEKFTIEDVVNDSVAPDSNAPGSFLADELLRAMRAGIFCEILNGIK